MLKSKIAIFLLFVSIFIFVESCRKKNDVIPDVYVDFYMDINDPEFFDLLAITGWDTVNYKTNNWGQDAAGFDNNGIIVYRALLDQFYAYDRTCPHDYFVNHKSVKVKVDGIFAICPDCGTQYALPNGGTPTKNSIGKYPLKNYKTSFNGQYIHVWN
jgi:nitrite reductase/ring-hydroxylating ferredoxin subunit